MIIGMDPHTRLDRWWVYDYFPETVNLDRKRYPPAAEIAAEMIRSGFIRCQITEVEHIEAAMPAQVAAAEGVFSRGFTSQLAILSEEEYERGLRHLNERIGEATSNGEVLLLNTDLRLYAVSGWVE